MSGQPLVSAFRNAINGLGWFVRNDRNGKLHFICAMIVLVAGLYFGISIIEWCILLLCMAVVISLEMLNHAMENLCDVVHEAHHPLIKTVKDVAAAAVLWSALISVIIGILIFVPKIRMLL